MHGLVDPQGMICALWGAQAGFCFHCDKPMILTRRAGASKGMFATREHIYPRGENGKALHHNIVLAHASCNNTRGCQQPTPEQLTKAKAIYMVMGLTPFVPDSEWMTNPKHWYFEGKVKAKVCGVAKRQWDKFQAPTMSDLWPK